MLPNAPYVFTRCSGLNDVFIICCGDSMFSVGAMLRNPTIAAHAHTMARSTPPGGWSAGGVTGSHDSHRSSSVGIARTIVSQFSHDRLPLTISTS